MDRFSAINFGLFILACHTILSATALPLSEVEGFSPEGKSTSCIYGAACVSTPFEALAEGDAAARPVPTTSRPPVPVPITTRSPVPVPTTQPAPTPPAPTGPPVPVPTTTRPRAPPRAPVVEEVPFWDIQIGLGEGTHQPFIIAPPFIDGKVVAERTNETSSISGTVASPPAPSYK